VSAIELIALRDHIAELRAAGATGTLRREVQAFVDSLKRGTAEEPCACCGGARSLHHEFVAAQPTAVRP
jgi:hypothetical protein